MRRTTRISMLVWLPLAFSLLIGVCVWAASSVLHQRSVTALEQRSEDIAAGRTLRAALSIRRSIEEHGDVRRAVTDAEREQDMTLLVLDTSGMPLVAMNDRETRLYEQETTGQAIRTLRTQTRWIDVESEDSIRVGLRVRAPDSALLITDANRASLGNELSGLNDARDFTLLIVLPVSILAGLALALLTAVRLRRVSRATKELASGEFRTLPRSRFPDEVGELSDSLTDTSRRLSELFSQVRAERARFEHLLARLHQGVVAVDQGGKVVYSNTAAAALLNVDDLSDGDTLPAVNGDTSLRDLGASLFQPDAASRRLTIELGPDRIIDVVAIPPVSGSDELASIVITDLTEATRRERAEREFVANAAHQIRTPLSTIRGSVDLLLADPPPPDDVQVRFLRHIRRETNRLSGLSRALLILARAEATGLSPDREPVALATILERSADAVEAPPDVQMHVPVDVDVVLTTAPDLLEQALVNLLSNSCAHTSEGSITVSVATDDDHCVISVTDTGSGIALEDQEHVFERFFRAPSATSDGFGLGLAIAQASIRAIGGELSITSSPGSGTTATISLPRVDVPTHDDRMVGAQ